MKKLMLVIILAAAGLFSQGNPIVGGDTTRIDGKLVMYLMSDHQGNGFYYGSLVGDRVMNILENYVINHAFGGAVNYQAARQVFDAYFVVDDKYIEIAQGMIQGMESAGISTYSPTLGENITYKDVLIANAIPDFTAFGNLMKIDGPGCSNLTSWNEATLNDPDLAGETVISRNLDWENNSYLIENPLIIVWGATDGNSQSIVTFGYPGMMGALSGINESGIATFQNMGNFTMTASGNNFYPVNLAQRDGLEAQDFNGDGVCSPRDISDAVREHAVAGSYIVHTAGPVALDIPAEILEIHNQFGDTIRTVENNLTNFGDNLVATNHFRLLKSPAYCNRYNRISDSLVASNQMNILRNWQVLTTAGVYTNLQTIQFTPWNNILRFSFAEPGIPAYQIEPTQVDAGTLFQLVGISEKQPAASMINIFPNPCSTHVTITVTPGIIDGSGIFSGRIFNLKGEMMKDFGSREIANGNLVLNWQTTGIPQGIYFFEVETTGDNGNRSRYTQKIIVSK